MSLQRAADIGAICGAVFIMLLGLLIARHTEASAPPEDLTPRIMAFEVHWEKFVRAYWGCPERATEAAECTGPKYLDYGEFNAAGRQARKLFALEERQK